jgi:hypothetical protein
MMYDADYQSLSPTIPINYRFLGWGLCYYTSLAGLYEFEMRCIDLFYAVFVVLGFFGILVSRLPLISCPDDIIWGV